MKQTLPASRAEKISPAYRIISLKVILFQALLTPERLRSRQSIQCLLWIQVPLYIYIDKYSLSDAFFKLNLNLAVSAKTNSSILPFLYAAVSRCKCFIKFFFFQFASTREYSCVKIEVKSLSLQRDYKSNSKVLILSRMYTGSKYVHNLYADSFTVSDECLWLVKHTLLAYNKKQTAESIRNMHRI